MILPTFYEGERAVQQRVGPDVRELLEQLGPRVIRDAVPEQSREFLAQLSFVIAGTVHHTGQPWALAEDVIEEIRAKQLGKEQSKALIASKRSGHKHASELRVSP